MHQTSHKRCRTRKKQRKAWKREWDELSWVQFIYLKSPFNFTHYNIPYRTVFINGVPIQTINKSETYWFFALTHYRRLDEFYPFLANWIFYFTLRFNSLFRCVGFRNSIYLKMRYELCTDEWSGGKRVIGKSFKINNSYSKLHVKRPETY